jgi:transposase
LEAEVARLRQNSSNSSKPPSSDPLGVERGGKAPTGRARGGQPGHKHHKRALLPDERVSKVVDLVAENCGQQCEVRLEGKDAEPRRTQVIEVPPIRPEVIECRAHELGCGNCGARTRAELPAEAESTFGTRLKAMIAVCTGSCRLSKRTAQDLLSDFLGVELALGSVCNIEREVSLVLAAPVEEARAYVRAQPAVHADETGWREAKSRACVDTAGHRFSNCEEPRRGHREAVAWRVLRWICRR